MGKPPVAKADDSLIKLYWSDFLSHGHKIKISSHNALVQTPRMNYFVSWNKHKLWHNLANKLWTFCILTLIQTKLKYTLLCFLCSNVWFFCLFFTMNVSLESKITLQSFQIFTWSKLMYLHVCASSKSQSINVWLDFNRLHFRLLKMMHQLRKKQVTWHWLKTFSLINPLFPQPRTN